MLESGESCSRSHACGTTAFSVHQGSRYLLTGNGKGGQDALGAIIQMIQVKENGKALCPYTVQLYAAIEL
jgi:hypothetical protein